MRYSEISEGQRQELMKALSASPLADRIRVFGSTVNGKANPVDIDIFVDMSDMESNADKASLLKLAAQFYPLLDPFVLVKDTLSKSGLRLITRDERAQTWEPAKHANALLKAGRAGRPLREIHLMEDAGGSFNGNQVLQWYFRQHPFEYDDFYESEWMADIWQHYRESELDNEDVQYPDLDDAAQREFASWFQQKGLDRDWLYHAPDTAPAWMLVQPVTGALLPATTWLAHFTDHADAIMREGFKLGVPDVNKIALTRINHAFGGVDRVTYDEPGFNFAYLTNSTPKLDDRWIPDGYGKQVLLFQSSGMLVHHNGDRETQVVFWGPAANLSRAHVIHRAENGMFVSGQLQSKSLDQLVATLKKAR
jgi:predicted nucleotidyltransferase